MKLLINFCWSVSASVLLAIAFTCIASVVLKNPNPTEELLLELTCVVCVVWAFVRFIRRH